MVVHRNTSPQFTQSRSRLQVAQNVVDTYDYLSTKQQENAMRQIAEYPIPTEENNHDNGDIYEIAHQVCIYMETKIKQREDEYVHQRSKALGIISNSENVKYKMRIQWGFTWIDGSGI